MSGQFAMGPCGCCSEPGQCIMVTFCPCITNFQAASNIGLDPAVLYFAAPFVGLQCCAICYMGTQVAEKRGIEHGMVTASLCALFDGCTCYSCAVVNECRLYAEGAGAPSTQEVTR